MNRCPNCDARLAHDQRYCVECGTRRGPLPPHVAGMIAAMHERGRSMVPIAIGPAEQSPVAPARSSSWLPVPNAAAVAVMAMLAFGTVIAAAIAPAGEATTGGPLIVVREPSPPAATATPTPTAPASVGSNNSSGGSTSSSSPAASAPASSSTNTSTTTSANTGSSNTGSSGTSSAPTNPYGLPSIKHVFVIMLSGAGYSQTFGSTDPYISKTLPKQGKLIQWYYAVAGSELANQIALISGQGPTQQTGANCPTFTDITPASTGKHDQVLGQGCVYPRKTKTVASQLTAAHLTWKAYIQALANGQPGQPQTCRHPAIGSPDNNQAPQPTDQYVTWRNPFVYFHSVIDHKSCSKNDVDYSQLSTDLTNASSTPNLSYIVPDPCDDGSPQPCTVGGQAGLTNADEFLKQVVPEIKNSAAYQAGGLILITFDQAPQTGPLADSSSCCSTPTYPNLAGLPATNPTTTTTTTTTAPTPTPTSTTTTPSATTSTTTTSTTTTSTTTPTTSTSTTTTPTSSTSTTTSTTTTSPTPTTSTSTTTSTATPTTTTPPASLGQGQTSPTGGGGHVGLLMISPWVKAGTIDAIDYYNHYSLLATIEDIFNLKHLGYAKLTGLPVIDSSIFDGKGPSTG
jgi:phosphatidylinositol-3-phosphatase